MGYHIISSEKNSEGRWFYPHFERVKSKFREGKQLSPGHLLVAKQGFTFSSIPFKRYTLHLNHAATQFTAFIEVHKGSGLDNTVEAHCFRPKESEA